MSHAGTSRTNMEAAFNKSTHGPAAVSPGRRGGTGRRTVSCPESVAYAKHVDYPTATGVRHHEEEHTTTGIYKSKDVDRRDDGRVSVPRIYDNPNTGTRVERDVERTGDGAITRVHKVYRNATTGDGL